MDLRDRYRLATPLMGERKT